MLALVTAEVIWGERGKDGSGFLTYIHLFHKWLPINNSLFPLKLPLLAPLAFAKFNSIFALKQD